MTTLAQLPAFALYDAMGVNVKVQEASASNVQYMPTLQELGVRHTRGKVGAAKDDLGRVKALSDAGIGHCFTIVQTSGGTLDWATAQKNIAAAENYPGLKIDGFEGPNEFNHFSSDYAYERDFIKKMHDFIRSQSALAQTKIIGPSVYMRQKPAYQGLGNISAYVDRGCLHYYTGAKIPTQSAYSMDECIADAHILTPAPLWVTECGYDQTQVGPRVQAKYMLRMAVELVRRGIERLHIFEFVDIMPGHEYGLVDGSFNKRPIFTAVKNLIALAKDVSGTTTNLDYQLSGTATGLSSLVLNKTDGSHLLVLWRNVASKEANVAPAQIKVNLAKSANLTIIRPTFSTSVNTLASGTGATVPVDDELTVLRVS